MALIGIAAWGGGRARAGHHGIGLSARTDAQLGKINRYQMADGLRLLLHSRDRPGILC